MVRKFDYSFLKDKVSGKIVSLLSVVYDIKGKESVRLNSSPSLFKKLKAKAIRDSIKASNAIENIHTTEKRIDDIAKGDNNAFTHPEKEIIGYRNVLNDIHKYYETITFDETTILALHKELLDVAETSGRGEYKKEPNIISERKNGRSVPIFIPTLPKDVKDSIGQALLAYAEAIHDPEINPLLLIPSFVLDFLCIHPFDDGNGRMSRLLTLLLLYKSGFDVGRFVSIEKVINDTKGEYYDALYESSKDWHDNKNDYSPFILYMIKVLYHCYKLLDENVFAQIDKKLNKSQRVEQLLLNAFVPLKKQEIMEQLPDISENLIEAVLAKLLKEDKIYKIGSFKGAMYYRK